MAQADAHLPEKYVSRHVGRVEWSQITSLCWNIPSRCASWANQVPVCIAPVALKEPMINEGKGDDGSHPSS